MSELIWRSAEIKKQTLDNKFVIVMPCYNAEETVEKAVLSVLQQDFKDLAIVIRNDMSTDHTGAVIKNIFNIENAESSFYIKDGNRDFIYIENEKKLYSGGNIYESVIKFVNNPYAVVGQVDGDDFLVTPEAVSIIQKAYADNPEKWLVYSQHISLVQAMYNFPGFSMPLPPDEVIYTSRKYWSVSHFRTCLAGLFDYLDPMDLRDPHDLTKYAKICGDASMLYAITEMCGNEHSLFIDLPLYFYNDGIPTNDAKLYKPELEFYKKYFESKPIYQPLGAGITFKQKHDEG